MAEERRGPEYVHAHVVQRKQERAKRNFAFALLPMAGIGLAILFTSVILPGRRSEDQYTRLVRAIRGSSATHTVEYRPTNDREILLREDWINGPRRRLEYFGGQFIVYHFSQDTGAEDYIHEIGPNILRKHNGANLITPAVERLLADLRGREVVSTNTLPDGNLEVTTRRKRLIITMDPNSGRPTHWLTLVPTDRGYELLTRTEAEYSVDPSKLDYDRNISSATKVDMTTHPDPFRLQTPAIANLDTGIDVVTVDVNSLGDVFYTYRSPVDRPYIEVTDNKGHTYSPMDIYQTSRVGDLYVGEQLALRMNQVHAEWPITITLRSRDLDPRRGSKGAPGKAYQLKFDRPSCFMTPTHWFQIYLSDAPLYSYQRTRHYRKALVLQNAMATPEGKFVDTLSGGAASLEQSDNLRKEPEYLQQAIREARQSLQVRAEFDGGRLSSARMYLVLMELYSTLGNLEDARKVADFARGMVREGRADSTVAVEIERAAKELGL